MALTDLTRISTSGIATGTSLSGAILHGDAHFRGTQVGVTSALFDSSDDALEFNDNVKLKFGNDGDLEIGHIDNQNIIEDKGNGALILKTNGSAISLQRNTGATMLSAVPEQDVRLFFNGNQKLNTTNDGVVVTGILTATGFSGPTNNTSGIATFYDLRVSNNLTVEGSTSTLDTTLIGVDRVEVGANSNTVVGVAVTQSGTADIVNLFDGATKVVTVDDEGKIGIGSATPEGNLIIHGGADNPGIKLKRNTGGGDVASITWGSNSANFAQINYRDASPHGLQFYSGGTASSNLSMIIRLDGNVGIGSDLPTAKLDVAGTSNFTGQVKVSDGTTSAPSVAAASDTNSGLYFAGTDALGLVSGGSRKLLVNSSGVTINNGDLAVNGGNLDVTGDIRHIDNTNTKIAFTSNQIDFQCAGSSRIYASNYGLFVQSGLQLGFLASTGPSPSIKSGGTNNQDLLLTSGTGNPTRLCIASAGKVGIGTDVPTAKLSVGNVTGGYMNATGIQVNRPHSLGLKNGILVYSDGGYNPTASYRAAAFKAVGTSGAAFGVSTDQGSNGLGGTLNARIGFDGGGYFLGNIGIGTDNPNHELTVYGDEPNFRLTHTGSTNQYNALYTHVDGTGVEFNSYQDGTGTRRPFIFKQYTTEVLRINSTGELTMTSATTKEFIAVNTTNNTTRGLISMQGKDGSGAVVTLKMGGFGDTGRGEIFTHSDHDLGFATNNAATQMVLDTDGKLLVGLVSDPAESSIVAEGNSNSGTSYAVLDLRRGSAAPSAGNVCGYIRFSDTNIDSTSRNYAWIAGMADGTSSSGADNPGRLVFATCPDNSTGLQERLRITSMGDIYAGNESGYAIFDNSTIRPRFQFRQGTGTNRGFALIETRGDANSMALYIAKSREGNGTGVINSGDQLGSIQFTGSDGTNQVTGASILAYTSGTIAADRIPTSLAFYTHDDNTSGKQQRMTIAPSGNIEMSGYLTAKPSPGNGDNQLAKGRHYTWNQSNLSPSIGGSSSGWYPIMDISDGQYLFLIGTNAHNSATCLVTNGYDPSAKSRINVLNYVYNPNGSYLNIEQIRVLNNGIVEVYLYAGNPQYFGMYIQMISNKEMPSFYGTLTKNTGSPTIDDGKNMKSYDQSIGAGLMHVETLRVDGALSKGSGSFTIPHPLASKKDTHHLNHSFIEGPQCDNIYRGKVTLSSGAATVNLDTESNMTEGTFVVLNRDVQCFTTNETGWGAIKGSVSGNILTISAQDDSSTDTISWMVVGERQDDTIKASNLTDDNGNLIVEKDFTTNVGLVTGTTSPYD